MGRGTKRSGARRLKRRRASPSGPLDAGPSNAGDRYHFVYTARRMLAMLPPGTDVKRIELEGVAPEDLAAGALSDDRFVGVDLTEYEGGDDGRTAHRVGITQVKYSPLHPDQPWTLSRLTASATAPASRSVVAKLARAFAALRQELRRVRIDRTPPEIVVELHTNQPLDAAVAEPLRRAKDALQRSGLSRPPEALAGLAPPDSGVLATLREATELGNEEFAEFIMAWDVTSFGRPMLAEAEAALWTALQTFTSDVHIGNLLSFVQEQAMPMRRRSVRRDHVLGLLRILEQDFWPAPPLFERRSDLIETDDLRRVLVALSAATPPEAAAELARPLVTSDTRGSVRSTEVSAEVLVVHGRSGTGKTSTLRLLARTPGLATITYDCFADAKGLEPTSARFPIQRCFAQVVNELDALLGTAVFATARLDVHHLAARLERAVRSAATAAAKRGMRLVLAFDAADNAQHAASRTPVQLGESFVPLLWTIAWPRNCTVIVSARSENLHSLGLPSASALPLTVRSVELNGFTADETARVAADEGETRIEVVERLHRRTRGNPRVVRRVLEALRDAVAAAPASDADSLAAIDRIARDNAFDYYRAETPERLRDPQDRRTLALLAEATQSVAVAQLAEFARRAVSDVTHLVATLAFGLRLDSDNRVAFRDQDFWDFVHEELAPERVDARTILADYVAERYDAGDPYARANLSRHFYAADRLSTLVDWWVEGDRLARDIDAKAPYLERAFEDVQYALLAASELGRDVDALTLLSLAGDVVQGRDLFLEHLLARPEWTVSLGALDEAIAVLDGQRVHPGLATRYTALANAVAADSTHRHRMGELLARASAVRREIYRRNEAELADRRARRLRNESRDRQGDVEGEASILWRGVLDWEDIHAHVSALARAGQIGEALAWLSSLRPRDRLGEAFRTLAREALAATGDATLVREVFRVLSRGVNRLRLVPAVRADWALGALIGGAERLNDGDRNALVDALVAPAVQAGNLRPQAVDVRKAIEALARAGARPAASRLIPFAGVDPPQHPHDPSVEDFLKGLALREALGLGPFEPDAFDLPRPEDQREPAPQRESERERGTDYAARRREEERAKVLSTLRTRFAAWYPAELLRARTLIGVSASETPALLMTARTLLETWRAGARDRWADAQREFAYDYRHVMSALLEAVVCLPARDADLVRAVVDAAVDLLPPGSGRGLERAAEILAAHSRYHREAEHVIALLRGDAKPPITRPADAVDMLLSARTAALCFDSDLAALLAQTAREVANSIEAEIPGRVAGLLALAERATSVPQSTTSDRAARSLASDIRRFLRLVAYLATAGDDREDVSVGTALRYLARVDAAAVAVEAVRLDTHAVLEIEHSASAIALGLIEGAVVPIDAVWPLVRLGIGNGTSVFRAAAEAAKLRGESVDLVLGAYAAEACRRAWRADGERNLEQFLEWASSLAGPHAVVESTRAFLTRVKQLPPGPSDVPPGAEYTAASMSSEERRWRTPRDEADARLAAVRSALAESPAAALAALSTLPDEVFKDSSTDAFVSLVADCADALPSARLGELASQVQRSAVYGAAFPALAAVARPCGTPAAREAVVGAYRRLLTPETLAALASGHYPEASRAAFEFELLEDRERLREIVGAVGKRLSELDATVLYRLTGQLAGLVNAEEARSILVTLVGRAWTRMPSEVRDEAVTDQERRRSAAPPGSDKDTEATGAVIALFADLHGHPAQRVRWRGLHAAVDAALALPNTVPDLLVTETFDSAHPRWLTKREWLLFGLECIARRAPDALVPHARRLSEHALSAELPHAKIRHHAREIVLAVGESAAGSRDGAVRAGLDAALVERVRAVNQPTATVPADETEQARHAHDGPRRSDNESWPDYYFDGTDTLRYWYEPLARVFGIASVDLADLAYPWIVGRWGITWSAVQANWKTRRWRWEELSHSHGSEPAVESLERYADRHGLYVAAGILVDSKPAVDDGPREGDRWTDWGRYHLRGADPALPARLLVAPPPDTPDHYGRFAAPYEEWRHPESLDAFRAELVGSPVPEPWTVGHAVRSGAVTPTDGDEGTWVVLSAWRSGTLKDRRFTVGVRPALVSRQTAAALQRLIHDSPRGVSLPHLRLGHDTILADIERDLRTRSDYYVSEQDWVQSHDRRFLLRALDVDAYQEMAFHPSEPWWPKQGRNLVAPILDFITEYELTRDPVTLDWRTRNGRLVVRCEAWFERDGTTEYSNHVEGARLLVRREVLLDFARRRDADVLLVVSLQRRRPYGRHYTEEPYDFGDRVAFRLAQDDVFRTTPRGTPAPDRRRGDRRRASDTASSVTEPEAGSDRA